MVTIVKSPKDFTPISEGLVFEVQSDVKTDFMVDIIDARTEEVVGSKFISGVEGAVVDIAPYVEAQQFTLPKVGRGSLISDVPPSLYYIVVDTLEDRVVSESVRVSNNLVHYGQDALQTIMPQSRVIGYGERDELRIVVPTGSSVWVDMTTDIGEVITLDMDCCGGVAQLQIDTTDFNWLTKSITVRIEVDGQLLAAVGYSIVPRYSGAVRVGWIGPFGGAEYYTFPITVSKSVVCERTKLYMHRVEGDIVSNKSFERLSLRSQALTESMAEALATILTAPKVWIDGDEVVEAQLTDNQVVTKSFGEAAVVEIVLNYGGKEVVL